MADADVDGEKIRFLQAEDPATLDSPFARIMIHSLQENGDFDEK